MLAARARPPADPAAVLRGPRRRVGASTSGTSRARCSRSGSPRPRARVERRRSRTLYGERFLLRRPLLEALDPGSRRPAGAADRRARSHRRAVRGVPARDAVRLPGLDPRARHGARRRRRRSSIITSNRTREIHDALKRRCLYHWIDYPDAARELAILAARAPEVPPRLAAQIVAFVQRLRATDLFKLPGVAETLDWGQALVALGRVELDPATVDATLGVLLKYQDDLARITGPSRARAGRRGARRPWRARRPSGERLAANVAHFARLLRRAGLPVGPGDTLDAQRAVAAIDAIAPRAVLLGAPRGAGPAARGPRALRRGVPAVLARPGRRRERARAAPAADEDADDAHGVAPAQRGAGGRRAAEPPPRAPARAAAADRRVPRVLRRRDAAHARLRSDVRRRAGAGARSWCAGSTSACARCVTRRTRPATRGAIDPARTVRRGAAPAAASSAVLRRRARVERPPAIVVLCDISGSMGRYSEMLLRFVHALLADARPRPRVPVRDAAHQRDPRPAPPRRRRRARALRHARSPTGPRGTRIGACLRRLQPHVVAPRARAGRGRAARHRRPRSRGHRRARRRGGAAAAVVPRA